VLQSMTGRDIWRVTKASIPFCVLLVIAIGLITIFPGIVTYLPNLMSQR